MNCGSVEQRNPFQEGTTRISIGVTNKGIAAMRTTPLSRQFQNRGGTTLLRWPKTNDSSVAAVGDNADKNALVRQCLDDDLRRMAADDE